MKSLILALVFSLSAPLSAAKLVPLPIAKLQTAKKGDCTLIHAWATWCSICLDEMPEFIKFLEKNKQIHPVVVDVSDPLVQKNFSKKWPLLLEASFTTYLKPAGKDELYLSAIDDKWDGALPYTALFHKGVRLETWVGSVPTSVIAKTAAAKCK